MAYQSKDVLEAMRQDSQIEITSMKVDGGACANNFLLQFQSDLLQMPVQRFKTNELTALGAAYLAGLAVGIWESKEEIKKQWILDQEFTCKMPEEERENKYKGWKKAVGRAMKWEEEE